MHQSPSPSPADDHRPVVRREADRLVVELRPVGWAGRSWSALFGAAMAWGAAAVIRASVQPDPPGPALWGVMAVLGLVGASSAWHAAWLAWRRAVIEIGADGLRLTVTGRLGRERRSWRLDELRTVRVHTRVRPRGQRRRRVICSLEVVPNTGPRFRCMADRPTDELHRAAAALADELKRRATA